VLLRPKTGLKDMVAELTPARKAAGGSSGERIPISQTLPDVNLDEILARWTPTRATT
jgi:phospholipid/cholesterol/gamma-HCH transport system substrate-binding protein